ncbi:MAG: metallophosphoesterase [Coriobacteriales bacterium]|nr:metallophosphoesterase [Coriobacteriales bacterium]
MTFSGGRTFEYDAETKTILMHKMYYLTFDPETGLFGESEDEADAAEIILFEREMPKTVKEEKFVPNGSDLPTVVRDAVKNADGSITMMFASDIHYSTNFDQCNLQVWYDNVQKQIGYIDVFGSCGDMGSAHSRTAEAYWNNAKFILDYVDSKVEAREIGTAIYTFGNHEWYPSAGGDFMNNYELDTAKRLFRLGEAMRTDDYIIYCLGAGAISARFSQGYSEEDIATVDEYLSTAPKDIPIFILTHFPVHFWGDRVEQNAEKLLDVFNKYPNIVVLWGHNHTDFDENYDMVHRPGDIITIDNHGTERQINFVYLSAGCMADYEYDNPGGGSAWVQGKGLVITIEADKTLVCNYFDMEGNLMSEYGPYLVKFREGVDYTAIKREYVDYGQSATAPEPPEIENYEYTGWDNDYSYITRHLVVTAQYEGGEEEEETEE